MPTGRSTDASSCRCRAHHLRVRAPRCVSSSAPIAAASRSSIRRFSARPRARGRDMKLHVNWGTGVAVVYTAFAVATSAFVVFALRRPVDLTAADYYAQSLREDQQMEAVRHTSDLHGT